MSADWSQLPSDLLIVVAEFFDSHLDIIRVRSVCSTWRSSVSAPAKAPFRSSGFIIRDPGGEHLDCWLSKRSIYLIESPETENCWVLKIGEDPSGRLKLLKLLSKGESGLMSSPRTHVFNLYHFRVTELAHEYVLECERGQNETDSSDDETHDNSDPSSAINTVKIAYLSFSQSFADDFAFAVEIPLDTLYMYTSRDQELTEFHRDECQYAIEFKGKFYAVDRDGTVTTLDPSSKTSNRIQCRLISCFHGNRKMLVKSGSDLLLVLINQVDVKKRNKNSKLMVWMTVFKLEEEASKWVMVKSLGGRVLFLGAYGTFSASISGVEGNCVVFSKGILEDDWYEDIKELDDVYLCNLDRAAVKPITDCPVFSHLFQPPPTSVLFAS